MIPIVRDAVTAVSNDRLLSMLPVPYELIADFLLRANDKTAGHIRTMLT
jgi:hypothetical protein